jgi:hypothetical protein
VCTPRGRKLIYRLFSIVAQVLRIALVDVGGLAVRHQQKQLAPLGLALKEHAGVAQSCAHARRESAGHACKPCLRLIAKPLAKILEPHIFNVVAAARAEAMDGERVADRLNRRAHERGRLARQIEDGFFPPL